MNTHTKHIIYGVFSAKQAHLIEESKANITEYLASGYTTGEVCWNEMTA